MTERGDSPQVDLIVVLFTCAGPDEWQSLFKNFMKNQMDKL